MHLFLEGPAKTGKSTLIRECIAPFISQIGGFSSQRLWQNGRPCGYRLTSAAELCLDKEYNPQMRHVFTWHDGKTSHKAPEIFETFGIALLSKASEKKLILLDEIGGSELLVPSFREKLYQTLDGPIPCIGVLKLSDKAKFMSKAAGYPGEVVRYNEHLREYLLEHCGTRILSYNKEYRDSLKEEILLFLKEIFHDMETL